MALRVAFCSAQQLERSKYIKMTRRAQGANSCCLCLVNLQTTWKWWINDVLSICQSLKAAAGQPNFASWLQYEAV